jgi:thiamine biosynthesis lipoprotein ApbE
MKKSLPVLILLLAAFLLSSCSESRKHSQAVYMLVDTSGTYIKEISKAARVINYLLATLNPGDSLPKWKRAASRKRTSSPRLASTGARLRRHSRSGYSSPG